MRLIEILDSPDVVIVEIGPIDLGDEDEIEVLGTLVQRFRGTLGMAGQEEIAEPVDR